MKRLIKIIDLISFIIFGVLFAFTLLAALAAVSFRAKRKQKGRDVNRLTFAVFDLTSDTYPCMVEEALLDEYLSKEHSLYIDFENDQDRFRNIQNRIYFYGIAAHPKRGLYTAGFRRMNMLITELKVLWRACRVMRKNNISFVRAHDPHFLGLNGLIIAKIFGLPCVLHMNSNFDEKYKGTGKTASPSIFFSRGAERFFEKCIIRFYDLISADREYYKHTGSFPKVSVPKYRACGVRVDSAHYAPLAARKNLKNGWGVSDSFVLLYVGRLHPVKYPQDVIECMRHLKQRHAGTKLVIAGDGQMRTKLEQLAADYDLAKDVIFLGSCKPDTLVDIYYSADIVIAPHGGVTLVEAALAARPIVAYDFDWHSEFIKNGDNGLLVPFHDTGALAHAVSLLINDPRMRKDLGGRALKKAQREHTRKMSLEREKALYDELLDMRQKDGVSA